MSESSHTPRLDLVRTGPQRRTAAPPGLGARNPLPPREGERTGFRGACDLAVASSPRPAGPTSAEIPEAPDPLTLPDP